MIAGPAPRLRPIELKLDQKLAGVHWPLVALLVLIGLVGYAMLYSAAGGSHAPWAWRHGLRLVVFVPVMVAMALVDLRLWYRAVADKRDQSKIDLERRLHTFDEVVQSLEPASARYEAQRCLSCGTCFECDGCYSACPERAVIKLGPGLRYQYDFDKCTGCAICYDQCPCGAITMIAEPKVNEGARP